MQNLIKLFEENPELGFAEFSKSLNEEDKKILEVVRSTPIGVETKTEVKVKNLPKVTKKYNIHLNNLNGYPEKAFHKLSVKTKIKKVYDSYFEALFDLFQTYKESTLRAEGPVTE